MPYCRNCGTSVSDTARICPNCNFPQDQPKTAEQPSPTPPAPGQPQQVQGGGPQSFPGPAAVVKKTDGQATAALVLGIVGLVVCPVVPSIIALILGKQSMNRIEASAGALEGYGMAKAGWILGIIGLVLGAIGILVLAITFSTAEGF